MPFKIFVCAFVCFRKQIAKIDKERKRKEECTVRVENSKRYLMGHILNYHQVLGYTEGRWYLRQTLLTAVGPYSRNVSSDDDGGGGCNGVKCSTREQE